MSSVAPLAVVAFNEGDPSLGIQPDQSEDVVGIDAAVGVSVPGLSRVVGVLVPLNPDPRTGKRSTPCVIPMQVGEPTDSNRPTALCSRSRSFESGIPAATDGVEKSRGGDP